MLKTSQMLVVSADDLQDFLNEKGYEIEEVRSYFWPEDFMNDCYKSLSLEGQREYDEEYGLWLTPEQREERNIKIRKENEMYDMLRKELGVNRILVDVSW